MLTNQEKKLHRIYRGVAATFIVLGTVIIIGGLVFMNRPGSGFLLFILSYYFYNRHNKILKKDEQGIEQPELPKLRKRNRIALIIGGVIVAALLWQNL